MVRVRKSAFVILRRERLVAEREGAARAWEASLRTEQAAVHQDLQDAETRSHEMQEREDKLREEEQVPALSIHLLSQFNILVMRF